MISTAQMNAYLLLLPQWVTAIYLVAAMVGLAGWNTPLGTRIGLTHVSVPGGVRRGRPEFQPVLGLADCPAVCVSAWCDSRRRCGIYGAPRGKGLGDLGIGG